MVEFSYCSFLAQVLQRSVTRRDCPTIQTWCQISECCTSSWRRPPCLLHLWIRLLCQTGLHFWGFEYLSVVHLSINLFPSVTNTRMYCRTDGVYGEAALWSPVSHRGSNRCRCGQHCAGVCNPCRSGICSAGLSWVCSVLKENCLYRGGVSPLKRYSFCPQSGLPYTEVLCKNRYVGRTFIQPNTRLRQLGVAKKFGVLSDNFAGKRVVIIDDSIVRGNTISPIIKLLREAGAKEVSCFELKVNFFCTFFFSSCCFSTGYIKLLRAQTNLT